MVKSGKLIIFMLFVGVVQALNNVDIEGREALFQTKQKSSVEGNIIIAHVVNEEPNGDTVNHEFRVPKYHRDAEPLPEELKKFHDLVMNKSIKAGKDVINMALIQGTSSWMLAPRIVVIATVFIKDAFGFIMTSNRLDKKFKRISDKAFARDSFDIIPELMKRAEETAEDPDVDYTDKQERIRVGRKLLLVLDGTEELVNNSPVGFALDYRRMTIDGKSMLDEVIECLKFMQKSGLGFVLNLFNKYSGMVRDRFLTDKQEVPQNQPQFALAA